MAVDSSALRHRPSLTLWFASRYAALPWPARASPIFRRKSRASCGRLSRAFRSCHCSTPHVRLPSHYPSSLLYFKRLSVQLFCLLVFFQWARGSSHCVCLWLIVLCRPAAPGTFDLLVYADKDMETPETWEESDPRYIENPAEVHLRSFTTKIHKVRYALVDRACMRVLFNYEASISLMRMLLDGMHHRCRWRPR